MNGMEKTITELHGMLKTAELGMKPTSEVLIVNHGKRGKKRGQDFHKGKGTVAKERGLTLLRHRSPSLTRRSPKRKYQKKEIAITAISLATGGGTVLSMWRK